jgi:hypothetical protein
MCMVTLEDDPILPLQHIQDFIEFHSLEAEDIHVIKSDSSAGVALGHLSLLGPAHTSYVQQTNDFLYKWLDSYF